MKNNFLKSSIANINSKPSSNSEVLSQILYGEKFRILSKKRGWVKIKTNYDNYVGYIKKENFYKSFKAERKIFKLKSEIFIKKNNKFIPTKKYLYFSSGVSVLNKYKNYIEFKKNNWIKRNDTKDILHR